MRMVVEPAAHAVAGARWSRRGTLGALAVALGASWWVWRDHRQTSSASLRVGRPLPAFALPRLGEPAHTLTPAELRGEVWLLNLWASWCAPCRDEHPLLLALARDAGAAIVGVAHQDDPHAADEWLRRLGNPYRHTVVDRDGALARALALDGVPQTLLIDREGVLRHQVRGPLSAERWSGELLPLLQRLRGAVP